MLEIEVSAQFKKDLNKIKKQGNKISKLNEVISLLQKEAILPRKYYDHMLIGNWNGYRECHITPNWLLIYKTDKNIIKLARTGSHSEIF